MLRAALMQAIVAGAQLSLRPALLWLPLSLLVFLRGDSTAFDVLRPMRTLMLLHLPPILSFSSQLQLLQSFYIGGRVRGTLTALLILSLIHI